MKIYWLDDLTCRMFPDETSKGIEARLQAATDSEYDQLRRENIATILSYGDSFMDLVCRDACDGLDVGRVCTSELNVATVT